jgi:hypothetical protein
MPITRTERHVAELPVRVRALLDQAREQVGLELLWTLCIASQLLREQLDACDEHLHHLLEAASGTDRLLQISLAAPPELLDTLADIVEHLGEGAGRLGVPVRRGPPGRLDEHDSGAVV